MSQDQVLRIIEAREGVNLIPPERIQYNGVQPFASDGIELWLRAKEDSIEIAIHHAMGQNFRAVLRRKYQEEVGCIIKGSILTFRERLSWARFEQISAEYVVRLVDTLRPKAFKPHNALRNLLMERLVSLSIGLAADNPSEIEYVLQFQDGLEFRQRVKRENASDIFGPR
ncbi:MAG: hypothetical protein PHI06_14895 [Desulfobulbaceae bacterium]|nr:hypothetical protein [Desulfobulbaceae bacterium]